MSLYKTVVAPPVRGINPAAIRYNGHRESRAQSRCKLLQPLWQETRNNFRKNAIGTTSKNWTCNTPHIAPVSNRSSSWRSFLQTRRVRVIDTVLHVCTFCWVWRPFTQTVPQNNSRSRVTKLCESSKFVMIALRRVAPPRKRFREQPPRQQTISVLVSCRNYTIQFLLVPYVVYSPGVF